MEEERVEKALIDLGLQRYEAEVYRVLIELGEATVREISTKCSVPREKIYFILKNLEKAGIVRLVEKQPKRYIAMPPEEVFKSALLTQKKKYETAKLVVNYLQKLYEDGSRQIDKRELKFWELGKDTFDKLLGIVESSSRYLYMVLSPRHIARVANSVIYERLKKLSKKGVEINVYTWFVEENIRPIGRLTNVSKVYVLNEPAWDASLILSDGDKGQLIFNEYSSIYFINRKMVEFYTSMLMGLEVHSINFDELDKIISIDEISLDLLISNLEKLHVLYDKWLTNLFLSINHDKEIISKIMGKLYDSLASVIPLSEMSLHSILNLITYLTYSLGNEVKISFSESSKTLVIEVPWSPQLDGIINNGINLPPSPWIYVLMEYLRRKGYKEQTTTIIHYKADGYVHFIKHFIKSP